MSLATDFHNEVDRVEKKYRTAKNPDGLTNSAKGKFDSSKSTLTSIIDGISGVDKENIYVCASRTRANNLHNRLAQGDALRKDYELAVLLLGDKPSDLTGAEAGTQLFIGKGSGKYDAICIASKPTGTWEINTVVESATSTIGASVKKEFPAAKIITVTSVAPGVPTYTDADFLNEVYMDPTQLALIKTLISNKKNIILQGAPGVGKSYSAERLAYAFMGYKDDSRILKVQFHQSYSYEDFIMGYRPTKTGFEIKPGPFFEFCNEANGKTDPYFVIIDEINRGNMSRIFGELLMLIEADKRGQQLRLLYQDKADTPFSVPENVYIIGMMNTADRSIAVIDYALRRRFAFIDFLPVFDLPQFKTYQASFASTSLDSLITCIGNLNKAIVADEALGEGFQIGHSYFCHLKKADKLELLPIVDYEIIPLLKEYWFDDKDKIDDWSSQLHGAL